MCRVETADGLHGWGEGTSPPNVGPVAAQIRSLGRLIQGERAWDTEKIWRRMYIVEENSLGGTLYAAMSAIDIALWDILGKALDVPVHDLLGGRVWNTLRIYTSLPLGQHSQNRQSIPGPYRGADRSGSARREVRSLRPLSGTVAPATDRHS